MDFSDFSEINIDQLLNEPAPPQNEVISSYKQISTPRINGNVKAKRSQLAERIGQSDDLIRQLKQLQAQNQQLTDLQKTAKEVTELYQKEKQLRLELEESSKKLAAQCSEIEKQLDVQVATCENLQDELQKKGLPVEAKDVLGILMQFHHRLGDDSGLTRKDSNIMKKLKEYCKSAEIPIAPPKSPNSRPKRKSLQNGVNQSTQTDQEPVPEKPEVCSVGVQVGRVVETRSQGSQYKRTTTTRGTTTACFIEKHDVGTSCPEPVLTPKVREILDEMLSWRIDKVSPLSPVSEVPEICKAVSVATCTTLCNIQREIDYMPLVPTQIKVSASRPPSRGMMDGIKEEARHSLGNKELAKELLHFLPQNQSCLANMSPQAFDELWQVFGQMVLGLLQRRSIQQSVSNADFVSWVHELYECAGSYPEAVSTNQPTSNTKGNRPKNLTVSGIIQTNLLLDFAAGTECRDVGTDPIIKSPNISDGGNVTPIRLPPQQPRERKSKEKKRKASSTVKSSSKRQCREEDILGNQNNENNNPVQDQDKNEQEPETAIQFLSNLNNFNMSNCDNLNMELDEEEMYLLQLTTQKSQEPEQPTCSNNLGEGTDQVPLEVNSATNELPAIQNEDLQPLPIEPEEKPEDPKASENCKEACRPPAAEVESSGQDVESSILEQYCRDAKARKHLETLKTLFGSDSDSDGLVRRNTNPGSHPDPKTCEEESESDAVLRLLTFRKPNLYSDNTSISSEEPPRQTSTDVPKQSDEGVTASICIDSPSESPESLDIASCQSDSSLDFPKHMYVSPWLADSISESDVSPSLGDSKSDCPETLEDKRNGGKAGMDLDDIQLDKYLTSELPSSISNTTNVDINQQKIEADNPKVPEGEPSLLPFLRSRRKDFYGSSDDSDDPRLIIDESSDSRSDMEKTPSPLSVSPKKPIKAASNLLEVRMTRFRAKQLQAEQDQKLNEDGRTSLVDQIRDRLKKSLPSDLEGRPLESNSKAPDVGLEETLEEDQPSNGVTKPKELPMPKEDKPCPRRSCVSLDASPASPPPERIDEHSPPIDIPLEQDVCQPTNGPPLLVHHVISIREGCGQRKLPKESQEKLNKAIEGYLEERVFIDSSLRDFEANIRKVNNNDDETVEAMITVICKVGLEPIPVSRLMVALQYFKLTERFMLGVELRLFRNGKDRPQFAMAMGYIKLYLMLVGLMHEAENPTRLLLAKILYHYDKDMPGLVLALLSQCPTVIPHREQREYDHSDPLITVIKHLLMTRKYDMTDPDSPERMLLSKLRFEYHFKTFEPTGNQVLENLVEKIKAGRLEQLGYAFALFCRRSPHLKVMDTVFGGHLLPLAASYCDLATQTQDFDDRLQTLVQCISMALKALPVETNISACVGFFKRLLVAVPRPAVQQSVVQGILRLQRFGFGHVMEVLQDYRPEYTLEPLTRAMLRSFAQRRKKYRYHYQSYKKFQRD
ncbi:hypothetical protein KR074_003445 [Drosophila pseudoananassae]|nr:hypothetical protein KR074_003445 [Drosophila pseudoananassae]